MGLVLTTGVLRTGTQIKDIEPYLAAGDPYGYAWNNVTSPIFDSLHALGSSIIGWTFYTTTTPGSPVTITAVDPLGTFSLGFSGDPGPGPYTAQSPDYSIKSQGFTIGPNVVLKSNSSENAITGSIYFDGSSWIETTQALDLTPNTGDFTVEWWQKMDPTSGLNARLWEIGLWPITIWGVSLEGSSSPSLLYWDSVSSTYVNGGVFPVNTWIHVAIVRQSNILTIYLNGQSVYTSSDTQDINNSGNTPLTFGAQSTNDVNTFWKGYLTNFRINHNAVYDPTQSNIIVPRHALTADANTKLLLLAADGPSGFTDSSGLGHVFTQNGNGATWTSNTPT